MLRLPGSVSRGFSFFVLMMRRPPRSTRVRSSAASDVYKRQALPTTLPCDVRTFLEGHTYGPVSYTHLRAHETPEHLVCRLLLEKKKKQQLNTKKHKKTRTKKNQTKTQNDNEK